jgi:hypothetical protein
VLASPNLAGPGLGGLEIPLLIILGALYVFIVYLIPIWLTHRAKKLFCEKKLTKIKLVLHVLPVIVVGALGLFRLFDFGNLERELLYILGTFIISLINVWLVYLGITTYRICSPASKI